MTVVIAARKRCTKCKRLRPIAKFSKNAQCRDGLASQCHYCRAAGNKQRRHEGLKPKQPAVCTVSCCGLESETRGYCTKHYAKWKRYKDPLYVAPPRPRSPLTWEQRLRLSDPERWADMKRQAYIKRRRLLKSAKQESYSRLDIFERDGWVCQLCHEPIDPALKGRTSRAQSIDHIVPLALGGDDTPENVQAAHFGCNSGKCHRVKLTLVAA